MNESPSPSCAPARCIVSITVEDRNGRWAVLQRECTLPFAPARGQELGWTDPACDPWSSEVALAIWELDAALWHVELEDWVGDEDILTMLAAMGPAWRVLGAAA